jgi:hypothetical protein
MIDTVQLRHQVLMPSPTGLQDRGFRRLQRQPNSWGWDYSIAGKTVPRLTWRSTNGGDWLTAEVSLPKLLYSENVHPITGDDVSEGLTMISELVSNTAGVSFNAATALVGRVDFYGGFKVGEDYLAPYLAAVSRANIIHLPRRIIENFSVTFKNKSKEIQLYDKWEEMLSQLRAGKATKEQWNKAAGILRLEVRYRTTAACKRLAHKYNLTYYSAENLLALEIASQELDEALAATGLNQPIASVDKRVDDIRNTFGDNALCRRLLGFITLLDRYGEGFWRHNYAGYKRSKYFKEASLLRNAGIWLYSEQPLPALQIEQVNSLARAA